MIKHKMDLLQNVTSGLNLHKQTALCNLEVVLYEDEEIVLKADVCTVLDFILNDIYWNEESNWSNANRAEVRSI